ncbi:GSCFA domain-containing protein [Maribacter sp. ACAM166]|uniref:GSCFA domain-containing protein n=1 Tax=Maribacter sp. ACAM166 TaxID=2508996 RepID=UPI0010FDC470|nr:GSCFA domain-containing protein [Maribacter sp. ACAM166]TLP74386.1 GSCFA domain-containing protein [Maribacter sp. ACAM166]
MKLLTQIPLSKAKYQIDYSSQIVLLGSCFSENIGDRLNYFKFQNVQNPLGILFHPLAIENLIFKAVHQELYNEEDVFNLNECFHCFDSHSSLSDISKDKLVANLNKAIGLTHAQLKKANHISITLGTAWVYRSVESGQVVANCHKVPQTKFTKELLGVGAIVKSLKNIKSMVRTINPDVQFIFTVSPVRHLKDGFIENQLSKAHLISAIHEIVNQENASYFPSYEIMMDELRDYRFYAKDMIHPNAIGIDYIWEKFRDVWIDDKIFDVMSKVGEIERGLQHRPFNPTGDAHQKFIKSIQEKVTYLKKTYPFMNFNFPKA